MMATGIVAQMPLAAAVFSADSTGPGAILNQDNTSIRRRAQRRRVHCSVVWDGRGSHEPGRRRRADRIDHLSKPVLPVAVMLGSTRIDPVDYYGAAPSAVSGLPQVNVKIPADAPSANVPAQILVGNTSSQTGLTVAIR
jgi:uncharacterized protein (TIGR03437 family)